MSAPKAAIAIVVALAWGLPVMAAEQKPLQFEVEELKKLIELQRQQIEAQERQIEEQQRRLSNLESTTSNLKAMTFSLYESSGQAEAGSASPRVAAYGAGSEGYTYNGYIAGVQPAVARQDPQSAQAEEGQAGAPGGQTAPKREVQVPAVAERTTALTREGRLIFEPSIEYNTSSLNRVILEGFTVIPAITVGSIDIREVDRDVTTAAASFRYGITDVLEAGVRVPYVYREDSTTTRPIGTGASSDVTTSVTGDGLGDVEFSLHYQLLEGGNRRPYVILNGQVKAPTGEDPFDVPLDANGLERELPTGTGFWGLEPGVTVLYPSDPVVFFGSASYLLNVAEDKTLQNSGTKVEVDPGDAYRFSLGMGFAINEQASFSLGYEHSFVSESEVDGAEIGGSDLQVGSLLVGGSYRVSDDTTVSLTVGVGATEEAPDVSLGLRVPIGWQIY